VIVRGGIPAGDERREGKMKVGDSKAMFWTGLVISVLAELFMLFDGVLHLLQPAVVTQSFDQLGFPARFARGIGILELVFLVLYAIPLTSVLGAVLLTGYLGGAIATQLRVGADPFTLLFPVIIAALLWAGLYLRDARLRTMFPLNS
jgi:hypothetical protein